MSEIKRLDISTVQMQTTERMKICWPNVSGIGLECNGQTIE